MDLLECYLEYNKIPGNFDKYCSTKADSMLYRIKTTTLRLLMHYTGIFGKFLEVEDLPVSAWPLTEGARQQVHKQFPEPMREAKLFFRRGDGTYHRTKKGENYQRLIAAIDKNQINSTEAWILNYLYLMDSYTNMENHYLVERSLEVYNAWTKVIDEGILQQYLECFLKEYPKAEDKAQVVFYSPITYLHCLHDDTEYFIKLFASSTEAEKRKLYQKVYSNYNVVPREHKDIVSKYYSRYDKGSKINGGNVGLYTFDMLYDDIQTMFYSLLLSRHSKEGMKSILNAVLTKYAQENISCDIRKVSNFISENEDVFEQLFNDMSTSGEIMTLDETGLIIPPALEDRPYEYIDVTTTIGEQIANTQFERGKPLAKMQSNYCCALEKLYGCNNFYFKSKTDDHHYLEVHHFLPREFRNEFPYSIEVMANYIPLCPRCHRMIHRATDDERAIALNYLLSERVKRLEQCGLHTDVELLHKLYHFGTR